MKTVSKLQYLFCFCPGHRTSIICSAQITDSPSLPATNKDIDDGLTGIMLTMATMQTGPDAILFIINFDLLDKEQNKIVDAYDALKDTFGEDILNYLVLVVAHSDTLERRYITVEEVKAGANVYFRKIIDEVKDRLLVMNNFDWNRQADNLLSVVRRMKDSNGHAPYVCLLCIKAKSLTEKEMMNMETQWASQDTVQKVNDPAARPEKYFMQKFKEVLMQEKEKRKWAKAEEMEDKRRLEEIEKKMRDFEESKRSTMTGVDHRKFQEEIEDIKRQLWMHLERQRWKDEISQLSNELKVCKASLVLEKENQKQMEKERERYWNKVEKESVYKHQMEMEAIKRQEIARFQNPGWTDIICSILKKLFGFNC